MSFRGGDKVGVYNVSCQRVPEVGGGEQLKASDHIVAKQAGGKVS